MSGAMHLESGAQLADQALRAMGLRCTVEARGNLAIVVLARGERALEDAAVRRAVLAALRSYGFTHAAVEPCDQPERATTLDGPIA